MSTRLQYLAFTERPLELTVLLTAADCCS